MISLARSFSLSTAVISLAIERGSPFRALSMILSNFSTILSKGDMDPQGKFYLFRKSIPAKEYIPRVMAAAKRKPRRTLR